MLLERESFMRTKADGMNADVYEKEKYAEISSNS